MSFQQSSCMSFEKFMNSWTVGECIFLWLLLLYCSWEWWRLVLWVCVCMCVKRERDLFTPFHHFCPSHTDCRFKLFPLICAPSSFASIWGRLCETVTYRWGNRHTEYPITILLRVSTHHTRSKHSKQICFAAATAHLLACQAFSKPLSQPVCQSAIQSSNQPAS